MVTPPTVTGPRFSSQDRGNVSSPAPAKSSKPSRAHEIPTGEVGRWIPPPYVTTKRAKPETVASANEWLRKEGVHQLPKEHPDRKVALVRWMRWMKRQPNPDLFKDVAANDPVRLGIPKGWGGVV